MRILPVLDTGRAFACLALASLIALGTSSCSKSSEAGAPTPEKTSATTPVDQKAMDAAKKAGDAAAKETGNPVREAETIVGGGAAKAGDIMKTAESLLGGNAAKKLRFSAIPNINTTELLEKNKPLADYLTKALGIPVEYVPVADYGATVDAFKNGDIDMCWFGGYTGCQAREAVPGAKAIACGEVDKKFKSYFVANASLGLEKSDAFPMSFKGRKFTFGSGSSTSGRLMPEYFIRKETGMSPAEFFGAEPSFSGSHDKTLELVSAGTFECGVADFSVYDKMVKEGKIDPAVVEVIWVTPEYFDYQFTVRPDLDQRFGAGFTQKLQKTLVDIDGADKAVLEGLQRQDDGLIACTNEDFEPLRNTAREIGLLR